MDRSELNKKANDYISNAGYGRVANITLSGLKCMMVDFYLDQVKNLAIHNVSNDLRFFGKKKFVFNCEDSNKQALEMFIVADSQKDAELEFKKRYPKYCKWNIFEL